MSAARREADGRRAAEDRWSRAASPSADAAPVGAPPPRVPTVQVAVEGVEVTVTSITVEGSPSPAELRGSLATLVLGHEDAEVHRARAELAAAVAGVRTPLGRIASVESWVRVVTRRLGPWGPVAGVAATVAAAFGVVGAPVWLATLDPVVTRDELAACALLAGVSALLLVAAVLASARLGRASDGGHRAATRRELAAIVAVGTLVACTIAGLVQRASSLEAWSVGTVTGLAMQALALAAGAGALVVAFAPHRIGGAASTPPRGVVLATPAHRLRGLAERFDASVAALDASSARALADAIDAEAERLVASGAISRASADAMREVPAGDLALDAHLAARLALRPGAAVVLRAHVPLGAVAVVLDGGVHRGRLARRIVAAVAGRRSRRRVPWEAGMLVDLVAAARVPVLPRDTWTAVAWAYARTVALVLAVATLAASVGMLAAWRDGATDLGLVAQPVGAVRLAAAALVLAAIADLAERLGRVRSTPAMGAWALVAGTAAVGAAVIHAATPYSPYLVGARAPWALTLVAIALVASVPLAVRLAERMRGRVHDAVHWRSVPWPLPRARVAVLERRRADAIAAASAPHVDAIVARLRPAIALAVDLGSLDAGVLDGLPAPRVPR